MLLALSICVLFISLIQPVNRAQFLNVTCLLVLFASAHYYVVKMFKS